jgi:signal transduction histidine kinase
MSDIVWSIDPRRDDLASLAARVRQFALGILEPRGVALQSSFPEEAARVRLTPELRRHLYLIFKEAINNAARHAGCRSVSILVRVEDERLLAEVKDDGRGFDVAARPTPVSRHPGGHGLSSMRSRAEALGGSLSITSAPGQGTLLYLRCPIERAGA